MFQSSKLSFIYVFDIINLYFLSDVFFFVLGELLDAFSRVMMESDMAEIGSLLNFDAKELIEKVIFLVCVFGFSIILC